LYIKYITMSPQIRWRKCWCRRKEIILTLPRLTFLSNTLTRDIQCFSCFEIYERSVTTSSSTLYIKNMSFFSIHFFLSFCNPFIQFFFIYVFSFINVSKINVNYVSISISFTIRSGVEDLDGNKRTNKKQSCSLSKLSEGLSSSSFQVWYIFLTIFACLFLNLITRHLFNLLNWTIKSWACQLIKLIYGIAWR